MQFYGISLMIPYEQYGQWQDVLDIQYQALLDTQYQAHLAIDQTA